MKSKYPSYLIYKQVKRFLHNEFSTNFCYPIKEVKTIFYYKLPFIGSFSNNTKKKLKSYVKTLTKWSEILRYKFVCAGCQYCYTGETKSHSPTKINEQLVTDKKSHIFKHLLENPPCKNL